MGHNDPSSDDYVAQVLAREARDSSLKYSAQGLGAYMPARPAGAAPKPNTRFLRHIIKETDNHNAALKRKEEREARERMRQLRHRAAAARLAAADDDDKHPAPDARRSSHRRRRDRDDDEDDRHRSHRRRRRSRSASTDRDRDRSHKHRRRDESDDSEGEERYGSARRRRRHHRHHHHHRRRSYSPSRSRSPRDEERPSHSSRRRERRRSRSRSPSRSRSRSPEHTHARRRHRERRSTRDRSSRLSPVSVSRESRTPPPPPAGDESDPLEDLVGPLPPKEDGAGGGGIEPIRSRGRGAYKLSHSNIDAHFAPDYDPTLDVQLEEDDAAGRPTPTRRPVAGLMTGDDDWELALEALRDRAHWRRRGEDRLREAGFNDAFVEKWKANTVPATAADPDSEGRLEEVRWSKKGEGREWDRGKFVDEDGQIDVKASW